MKVELGLPQAELSNHKCDLPIAGVDAFLKGKKNVTRRDTSEIELKAGAIPAATSIIVLQPAL